MVSWFSLLVSGFCMGVADLMPGISGSTVAMLLGFYDRLIYALRTLQIRDFLLPLGVGVLAALLVVSQVMRGLLSEPFSANLLYGFFGGLVFASVFLCVRRIPCWTPALRLLFLIGVGAGQLLIRLPLQSCSLEEMAHYSLVFPWLIFCGICGVTAFLLPGISGSYVLLLLGVYPLALGAMANVWHVDSLQIVGNLLAGAIGGALLFSHLVSWLLKKYHDATMAPLTGLIAGTLPLLWPLGREGMTSWSLLLVIGAALFGFCTVQLLETRNT